MRARRLLALLLVAPARGWRRAAAATTRRRRRDADDAGAEALKVGLITDLGQLDDNGFNELAFKRPQARGDGARRSRAASSSRASAADYMPNMSSLARAGLRPDHRRRLRAGRRDRQDREALPEDEVRDHRRRPERSSPASRRTSRACSSARRRSATSSATSRGCRRRRARGRTRSAPSAASRSRRSTASSRATRRVRRRRRRGSPCAGTTPRTGTTRRSARSSR